METEQQEEYVGFWPRLAAGIVDGLLLVVACNALLMWVYGLEKFEAPDRSFPMGPADVVIQLVLPGIAAVLLWHFRQATPGKMLIKARVVDAQTGGKPSIVQLVGRFVGYYASIVLCFAGFLWIAFDARKQGLHDKLAGTVVVRAPKAS